ncbi:hypothetical protein Ga0100231_021140 [Opitutaceae bacterium TAV4]|nr:hypothetical protein Ga0100231_021140 [Opitutaceae bacterium TAV4]RRK00532.1 hypothetical protein Ga0100230_022000 [Opitutaceae bacterium TAV3]
MKQTVSNPHASQPEERRSRAFLRLLADICRRFPDLREWFFEDFAQDAQTRANFLALVENGSLDGESIADGFAEVAGELGPWLQEKHRIQAKLPARAVRPFGGLTWDEMESLVRRYEARTLRLDVFLLVRDWRKAGETAKASPKLLRTSASLLDQAIRSGDTKLVTQLVQAIHFLTDLEQGRLQSAFGYADWWKLHALVYMLRHPREAYRTRDVRAHLATLGLQISSLDFRRFCNRHGIRRDKRAGRPRTRPVSVKRGAGAGLAPVRPASLRGGTGRSKAS